MPYFQVFDGVQYRTVTSPAGPASFPTTSTDDQPRSVGDLAVGESAALTEWDEDWTYPTLINGWTNYGNNYNLARFRKVVGGLVVMQGLLTGGTANSVMFVLPTAYAPTTGRLIIATYVSDKVSRLQINEDGSVYVPYSGSTSWHSIECTFFAS